MNTILKINIRTLCIVLGLSIYVCQLFPVSFQNEQSSKNEIKMIYTFSMPQTIEQDDGTITLNMEGLMNYSEIGNPLVPYYLSHIAIPKGKCFAGMKFYYDDPQIITLKGQLRQSLIDQVDSLSIEPRDSLWQLYPDNIVDYAEEGVCRGISLIDLALFPVRVKRDQNTVMYYEKITVVIELKDNHSTRGLKPRFDQRMAKWIDNPLQLSPNINVQTKGVKIEPDSLCDPSLAFSYVIITSQALKNSTDAYSINAFCSYKNQLGVSTHIVTVEEIYGKYAGRDNQEKIRNFIKDAYNNWETDYVLLAGDVEHVPARLLYARNIYVPADMYYGCLDGDFNSNNNAKWGEAADDLDFLFDVYVGRASANNSSELSNFVYKTITYDQSPVNASYHTKMVQYNQNISGIGNTSSWVNPYRKFQNDLSAEYHLLTNSQADVTLMRRLNSSNIGFYLGASHGVFNGIGNISNIEANRLKNGNQFYLMATIACLSGSFDVDCVAEHLTTHNRTGGAFAGFFNSRNAYPPYIVRYLYTLRDEYYENNIKELGALRAAVVSCYSLNQYSTNQAIRYQAYEYNLFGDPQLIWHMKDAEPIDLVLDFESPVKDTCRDLSGNANIVLLKNGAVKSEGLSSKALDLTSDGSYAVMNHSDWNPMGDQMELTLSLDVCVHSVAENAGLLVKGDAKNPFALTLTKDGKLQFALNKNTPSNAQKNGTWISNARLTRNMWHHVAVTMTYETSKLSLYLDGELDFSTNLPSGWMIGYDDGPLYLGLNKADGGVSFDGYLDNVRIFSNDRSVTELSMWAIERPKIFKTIALANKADGSFMDEYSVNQSEYVINDKNISDVNYCISVLCSDGFDGSIVFECGDSVFVSKTEPFLSFSSLDSSLNTILQDSGLYHVTIKALSGSNGTGFVLEQKSLTIHVITEKALSLFPFESEKINVKTYPNPLLKAGVVNVEFTAVQTGRYVIAISNALGQVLEKRSIDAVKGGLVKVQLGSEKLKTAGVYCLHLEDEEQNILALKTMVFVN